MTRASLRDIPDPPPEAEDTHIPTQSLGLGLLAASRTDEMAK